MKKVLFLALFGVFMLTGCGATETLNCEYKTSANNMATKVDYDIDHQGSEVKKVRITYDYTNNNNTNNNGANNDGNNGTDGVGTGTDGTTNDTQIDNDGIVDGIIGSAIDGIIGGVSDVILDVSGLRDRHAAVQNTYGNISGFSVQNTTDVDNNYRVTYVIDYDTIGDNDLATLNLSRDYDTLRNNFVLQGFTCK